jgi:pimeloyl-ACP methyl ester carboxylesterase
MNQVVSRPEVKAPLVAGVSSLTSPFKTPKGEAEYMASYDATMQLWSVPYESLDIRSQFGTTHVVSCGPQEAPPLILLHSFFSSSTNWAYNIPDLSRDHHVYAVDMMGQPSKSVPDQPIANREELALWLTGILNELSIGQTDLVGYSYGGFSALNYAIQAPNRIKKLVLLTPVGALVPLKTEFFIRAALISYQPFKRLAMKSFLSWTFYRPNLTDARTARMFDCMLDQMSSGAKYWRSPNLVLPLPFADEELRMMTIPTLLLIGRQETYYDPLAALERGGRLLPIIEAELIPQACHELPISKPEVVNQRILAFLENDQVSSADRVGRRTAGQTLASAHG